MMRNRRKNLYAQKGRGGVFGREKGGEAVRNKHRPRIPSLGGRGEDASIISGKGRGPGVPARTRPAGLTTVVLGVVGKAHQEQITQSQIRSKEGIAPGQGTGSPGGETTLCPAERKPRSP